MLLIAPILLFSEAKSTYKIVELVADFYVDTSHYSQVLTQDNYPAQVVSSDLKHYGIGKERKDSLLKMLRKWSLDFWKSIPLEKNVEKIVFFNISSLFNRDFYLNYLPKDKLLLFMWEPPLILPKMYKPKTTNKFSKIYTWDDDLVDGKKFFKFYYPVLKPMLADLPSFEEKKLCTLVATCYHSHKPGCLYHERKKAIKSFERIGEEGFEFYGRGWNGDLYKNYKGAIEDKIQTIKNYRFSICYENCNNRNGYITEKIFDCFAAGNVPIYWGAPNIEKYIPKECFIDRRDFSSFDELYSFLKNMSKQEYEVYLQNIRAYLTSERAQLFSQKHFDDIFAQAISGEEKPKKIER